MLKSLFQKLSPKPGSLTELFAVIGAVGVIVAVVLWSIRGGLTLVINNIIAQVRTTTPYEVALALIIMGSVVLLIMGLFSIVASLTKK